MSASNNFVTTYVNLIHISVLLLIINYTEPLPSLFSDICDSEIAPDPSSKSSLLVYYLFDEKYASYLSRI